MRRKRRVVRHQHQCSSLLRIQPDQKFEDVPAVRAVEIPRRFVRQENRRPHHESPGKSNALLFARRQLHGIMVHAIGEPDFVKKFAGSLPAAIPIHADKFVGKQNVLLRRQRRNQLIRLKNEADLSAPYDREPIFSQSRDLLPIEDDLPGVGASSPASRPSNVLFPLPEAPIMAANCPAGIVRSIPFRISTR